MELLHQLAMIHLNSLDQAEALLSNRYTHHLIRPEHRQQVPDWLQLVRSVQNDRSGTSSVIRGELHRLRGIRPIEDDSILMRIDELINQSVVFAMSIPNN